MKLKLTIFFCAPSRSFSVSNDFQMDGYVVLWEHRIACGNGGRLYNLTW